MALFCCNSALALIASNFLESCGFCKAIWCLFSAACLRSVFINQSTKPDGSQNYTSTIIIFI